jgi:hypothetical protein
VSQDEHFYRLLKSGKQIVNVDAMVGAKWAKDRLYVLFAGQQYMDISGREAEAIWEALCRLSTEANGFGVTDRVGGREADE